MVEFCSIIKEEDSLIIDVFRSLVVFKPRNNGHKEGQIFACKIFPSTPNSAKTSGGRRKKRHVFDVILAKDHKNYHYVLV